jgi:hypothetical protein
MSIRFEEKFVVKDSAGDELLPLADICKEFRRAERSIDTRQHWKKRTAFQMCIYIHVCVCVCLPSCFYTGQLLVMYYMHAQHSLFLAAALNNIRNALASLLLACLCGPLLDGSVGKNMNVVDGAFGQFRLRVK